MARFDRWVNEDYGNEEDYLLEIEAEATLRRRVVALIQHDLAFAAARVGQTSPQIENKMDELFSTLAAEWSIYILVGAPAIVTALQDDVTMPWLDTQYPPGSGITIRQRLINRLS